MSPATTEKLPTWWPVAVRSCVDELESYRLIGASACADRITDAVEQVAVAAAGQGIDVAAEMSRAGDRFCALKPDTALYVNVIHLLTASSATADDVVASAARLRAYRTQARAKILDATVARLTAAKTILVHDYSSAAAAALVALSGAGCRRRVVVSAGDPLGQGERVARLVAEAGHQLVYAPDASLGRLVPDVDVFLTGVETFYPDGSLANTVGTLAIALLCREFGTEVLAPTECLKLDARVPAARTDVLTARLLHPWPGDWIAELGATVEDHVLDAVPARLVNSYVTETGVLTSGEVGARAAKTIAALKPTGRAPDPQRGRR